MRGFEPRSEVKTNRPSTYIVQQFTLIADSWLNSKHPKRSQGFEISLMLPSPNINYPNLSRRRYRTVRRTLYWRSWLFKRRVRNRSYLHLLFCPMIYVSKGVHGMLIYPFPTPSKPKHPQVIK